MMHNVEGRRVAADVVDLEVYMPPGSPWISTHSPYLAHQLSTKDVRQSTEGYPAMVDLSVGVRVIRIRIVTQGAETTI